MDWFGYKATMNIVVFSFQKWCIWKKLFLIDETAIDWRCSKHKKHQLVSHSAITESPLTRETRVKDNMKWMTFTNMQELIWISYLLKVNDFKRSRWTMLLSLIICERRRPLKHVSENADGKMKHYNENFLKIMAIAQYLMQWFKLSKKNKMGNGFLP